MNVPLAERMNVVDLRIIKIDGSIGTSTDRIPQRLPPSKTQINRCNRSRFRQARLTVLRSNSRIETSGLAALIRARKRERRTFLSSCPSPLARSISREHLVLSVDHKSRQRAGLLGFRTCHIFPLTGDHGNPTCAHDQRVPHDCSPRTDKRGTMLAVRIDRAGTETAENRSHRTRVHYVRRAIDGPRARSDLSIFLSMLSANSVGRRRFTEHSGAFLFKWNRVHPPLFSLDNAIRSRQKEARLPRGGFPPRPRESSRMRAGYRMHSERRARGTKFVDKITSILSSKLNASILHLSF